jgi:hypothetical protein
MPRATLARPPPPSPHAPCQAGRQAARAPARMHRGGRARPPCTPPRAPACAVRAQAGPPGRARLDDACQRGRGARLPAIAPPLHIARIPSRPTTALLPHRMPAMVPADSAPSPITPHPTHPPSAPTPAPPRLHPASPTPRAALPAPPRARRGRAGRRRAPQAVQWLIAQCAVRSTLRSSSLCRPPAHAPRPACHCTAPPRPERPAPPPRHAPTATPSSPPRRRDDASRCATQSGACTRPAHSAAARRHGRETCFPRGGRAGRHTGWSARLR